MSVRLAGLLQHLCRLESPVGPGNLSDAALLERFVRRRDQDAFAVVVGRHGPMVLHVCRRVLGDAQAAEDAFQATFLVLARRADVVRPGALAAWLYGTAQRVALKSRAAMLRRRRSEGEPMTDPVADPRPDPLAELSARELLAVLDAEVTRLPEVYRLPIILCCLEGRSQEEAARLLGWTAGSVKGRLERGRVRLHAQLARRGLTLAAAFGMLELARGQAVAVPGLLTRTAVHAALTYANGGTVAAPVAALAETTRKAMQPVRWKITAALLLALTLTATAVGYRLSANGVEPGPDPTAAKGQEPTTTATRQPGTDRYGDSLPAGVLARLGTVRLRHGHNIQSVAFTADGQLVSNCFADGVRFWDTATGREIGHLESEAGASMSSACLSPDGKQIVTLETGTSGGAFSTIRVWDRAEMKVVREVTCSNTMGFQFDLRLSPDGKVFVVDGAARCVWDVATLKELRRLEGGAARGWCKAFSPDGRTFIASDEGVIRFWDVATGRKEREIATSSTVYQLALSPDGRLLATVGGSPQRRDDVLRLWDLASGKEVRQLTMPSKPGVNGVPQGFNHVAFAADSKTLIASGQDGVVRFWDPSTGKETRTLVVDSHGTSPTALSQDGKMLAVVTSETHRIGHHDKNNPLFAIGGSAIRLIDLASGKDLQPRVELQGGHYGTDLASDGRTAATITRDNAVLLWDPATGKERGRLEGHSNLVNAVRILPDGRTLLSASVDGTLRVWDLTAGKEVRRLNAPFVGIGLFAVSADGKTAVLAQGEETVALVDVANGTEIRRLKVGGEGVEGAAFAPDGKTLIVWARDHTAHVWDLPAGRELRQFRLYEGSKEAPGQGPIWFGYRAVVSLDGRLIAYGSQFRFLTISEVATGKQLRRLEKLPDRPWGALAFTPDGRTLAWGGSMQPTIHLIEVATGRERGRLVGHKGAIETLTCSADGRMLISASDDTTALVWDLRGSLGAGTVPERINLDECWSALAGADADQAYRAVGRLAAAPAQAVPYLGERLRPVPTADDQRLARLIAELDSDQFVARDQATKTLEELAEAAVPALRQAAKDVSSAEARRRIEALLEVLEREPSDPSPERLRVLRAIEVLEWADTVAARQVLRRLAQGAPIGRSTREATEALRRLEHGP